MHGLNENATPPQGKIEPRTAARPRRATRPVRVGTVQVGGGAPVSIQSMTNADPLDVPGNLAQIRELAAAGCDIVRVAVPTHRAVAALAELLEESPLPVVADIHFDYRLAVAALEAGVHGVRINPGNIGGTTGAVAVARAAATHNVPVRIGVNAGSLEPDLSRRYGGAVPEALAESALRHCETFERAGCSNLKVSLKSSDVRTTVAANRIFAARSDYPLHLGITEAGTEHAGIVKSAVGIGTLLLEGIGDTIRVSLTAPPVREVETALQILEACGLRNAAPEIVACPTCGRTQIDLIALATAVEREVHRLKAEGYRIAARKIAVMGCAVNGPGEARDADIGIAGGKGLGVLFANGEIVRSCPEERLLAALVQEIRKRATKVPASGNPAPP